MLFKIIPLIVSLILCFMVGKAMFSEGVMQMPFPLNKVVYMGKGGRYRLGIIVAQVRSNRTYVKVALA